MASNSMFQEQVWKFAVSTVDNASVNVAHGTASSNIPGKCRLLGMSENLSIMM